MQSNYKSSQGKLEAGGRRRLLLATLFSLMFTSYFSTAAEAVPPATGTGASETAAPEESEFSGGGRRQRRFRRAFEGGGEMPEAENMPSPQERFRRLRERRMNAGEGEGMMPGEDTPGGGRRGGGMGRMSSFSGSMGRGGALNLTELNLTEEQKTKIKTMRSQTQLKAKELQKDLKAKRAEMRDLLFEPNSTAEQIKAKHSELKQTQEQVENLMINDFIGIRSVLTSEQKKKLPLIKPGARPQPGPEGAPELSGRNHTLGVKPAN